MDYCTLWLEGFWSSCCKAHDLAYEVGVPRAIADTAVQPADLAAVATTGAYADLSGLPALGTAAFTNSTTYATAAQGDTADTALQPSAIGTTVQALLESGTNIKTVNSQSLLGSGNITISGGGGYNYVTTATSLTAANLDWVVLSGAGQTITLPSTPVAGYEVVVSVGNFTNTVVNPGAETVTGIANTALINNAYATVTFHYDGTTWRYF